MVCRIREDGETVTTVHDGVERVYHLQGCVVEVGWSFHVSQLVFVSLDADSVALDHFNSFSLPDTHLRRQFWGIPNIDTPWLHIGRMMSATAPPFVIFA